LKYEKGQRDNLYGPTLIDIDTTRVKKFPLYQCKNNNNKSINKKEKVMQKHQKRGSVSIVRKKDMFHPTLRWLNNLVS
jgi:hypothetical protein